MRKIFILNYSKSLVFYTAKSAKSIPLHINQFTVLLCKRDKTTGVIKNLVTGESAQFDVSQLIDNPGLYYLWRSAATVSRYGRVAIAGQTICNGYFSTDEDDEKVLNYYKQEYPWLFPDQAWTVTGKTNEDEDRATIANITGNGNDLVLSNFGFAGNSGYGDYPISFSEGQPYGTLRFKTDGKYSNLIKTGVTDIRIKFNLRGMPERGVLSIRGLDPTTALPITEKSYTVDGLYEFVYNDSAKPVNIVFYNGTPLTGLFDFYVDIIPEYEGYLVTDGVDDQIRSSAIIMGKDFTVVTESIFIQPTENNVTGIVKPNSFSLYNYIAGVNTYINRTGTGYLIRGTRSIKAFSSDGRLYSDDWSEHIDNIEQTVSSSVGGLTVGYSTYGATYTKLAFKNLAIYSEVLSKEDCIKAYNYLQTLKAK